MSGLGDGAQWLVRLPRAPGCAAGVNPRDSLGYNHCKSSYKASELTPMIYMVSSQLRSVGMQIRVLMPIIDANMGDVF